MAFTQSHADRGNILWNFANPAMDMHRTALLCQSGHFHDPSGLTVQMRSHRKQCTNGHNTRAPHPGDNHIMGAGDGRQLWIWQIRNGDVLGHRPAQLAAFHCGKGRAEPIYAAEILIAAGLINLAFAPQWGFQWQQRHAIGLHTAIPTAFADRGVDKQPLGRVRKGAAFAAAALFSRAGLHINDNRDALQIAEDLLHADQLLARMQCGAIGKLCGADIFFFIIDYGEMLHADATHLLHDTCCIQPAVIGLPSGHRHGVVEQYFIGHGRARGHGGTNGLDAGMVIGPVANILKHVFSGGKQRLSNPIGPLSAHLGEAQCVAVHPLHHIMAANARISAATFWNFG